MNRHLLNTLLLAVGCHAWSAGCRSTAPAGDPPVPAASPDGAEETGTAGGVEGSSPLSFSNSSRAGKYLVSWTPAPGSIPLNETFEIDVTLAPMDEPESRVTGAEVYVHASMPEHGHGMLREPQAREIEPGVYRVEGMLLHMTGYWQVFVDIVKDGVAETADFELTLE